MPKILLKIFLLLLIPIIVSIFTYSSLKSFFFEPVDPKNTEKILVELTPGTSFRDFCKELAAKGIIKHWRVLDIVSQVKASDKGIKAGEYEFSPSMSAQKILRKLTKGDVIKRVVTIKEGMTIWDVADELDKNNIVAADEFFRLANDKELLKRVDIEADSFEGYLFPETYHFSGKQTGINVIWRMLEEFHKNWDSKYNDRLKELGFTLHEIITLASVIEKESGQKAEQKTISSVFYNRLINGMRLESDPTLVYGLLDFDGVVLNKHKETDSPYNTYKNAGLPKGPICSPGKTAIEAALYPDKTEFLFFVADGNGGHVFSKTLKDHNEAVRNYRQIMSSRQNSN